jgi:hypothetical protein
VKTKSIIISTIIILALTGAAIAGAVLWSNHQAKTENAARVHQMQQVLLGAELFGMHATGLPEQKQILAYRTALSEDPDAYSRVEFAQIRPLLEDCEWGVIYIVPTELFEVRIERLNNIIQKNPSMELYGFSYPVTMNDYASDPLAFYYIAVKFNSSQYDEFRYGRTSE